MLSSDLAVRVVGEVKDDSWVSGGIPHKARVSGKGRGTHFGYCEMQVPGAQPGESCEEGDLELRGERGLCPQ